MDLSEYEQLKYEVDDKIYQKEKDINKTNRVMFAFNIVFGILMFFIGLLGLKSSPSKSTVPNYLNLIITLWFLFALSWLMINIMAITLKHNFKNSIKALQSSKYKAFVLYYTKNYNLTEDQMISTYKNFCFKEGLELEDKWWEKSEYFYICSYALSKRKKTEKKKRSL